MGQAKLRRASAEALVYHHTSTLRTNQLWMDGYILPEGKMKTVLHPQIGEVGTDAQFRRPMIDFPPLVWLTRQVEIPRCLLQTQMQFVARDTGEVRTLDLEQDFSNAIALNRVALGFKLSDIAAVPWQTHPGFTTAEGRGLNETAREAGDDPEQWYVAEQSLDLMLMSEIRVSRSIRQPKLRRTDQYLIEIKKLIYKCRTTPGIWVPPAWLKPEDAKRLAASMNIPVGGV